jgi:dihydroorotate dehydrogenase electron transfer subunit
MNDKLIAHRSSFITNAHVVRREQLAPDVFSYWLDTPVIARRIRPGQFVQALRGSANSEVRSANVRRSSFVVRRSSEPLAVSRWPLLRRPLSIAEQKQGQIRLVFRVVGAGTRLLAETHEGDEWDLLGPLGKPAPVFRKRPLVLVGGGIGIAPLLFLAERTAPENPLTILLGARTRAELILQAEFRRLPHAELQWATDDGSLGHKGTVTDLLGEEFVHRSSFIVLRSSPVVVACGPRAMLRRVKEMTGSVEAYAFWEERMGCGTGICYGCAVKSSSSDSYIRFCQEGPVLNLKDVEF